MSGRKDHDTKVQMDKDIAFLELDESTLFKYRPLPLLFSYTENLNFGDQLLTIGYPSDMTDGSMYESKGFFKKRHSDSFFDYDAITYGGNSGGGILINPSIRDIQVAALGVHVRGGQGKTLGVSLDVEARNMLECLRKHDRIEDGSLCKNFEIGLYEKGVKNNGEEYSQFSRSFKFDS